MNGDFFVLNLFGDVAPGVDGRSHHEPTNNGPSARIVDVLNHGLELMSQGNAVAFLVSCGVAGTVDFVVLEENFSGLERTESDNSSGVGNVGWGTLVSAMNRGRNRKL